MKDTICHNDSSYRHKYLIIESSRPGKRLTGAPIPAFHVCGDFNLKIMW